MKKLLWLVLLAASTAWAVDPTPCVETTGDYECESFTARDGNRLATPRPNALVQTGNNAAVTCPTPAAESCVLCDESTGNPTGTFVLRCGASASVTLPNVVLGPGDASHPAIQFALNATPVPTPSPGVLQYDSVARRFLATNWLVTRSVSQVIGVIDSNVTVGNTTVETTIYTVPHGANYLYPGKVEDTHLVGTISSVTGLGDNTLTFRLKYAGVTQATWVVTELSRSSRVLDLHAILTVRAIGSGTTSIQIHGEAEINQETLDPAADVLATGLDSTTAQATTITAQWSDAVAGNTMTITQGYTLCLDDVP